MDTPSAYKTLDAAGLRAFLAGLEGVRSRLGGDPGQWHVREVSDGYLNLVHVVDGPAGSVYTKQALPHVRADKDWRLPLTRTEFEHAYFAAVAPHVGGLVPMVHHYDPGLYLIVMEALAPHAVLRGELLRGKRFPEAAAKLGAFVARAGFFTSDLHLPLERRFDLAARFSRNQALLRISAELIFRDPYRATPRNRWTSPQLDGIAARFRLDGSLRRAVARLGQRFLTEGQALVHGDLHTGAVMVSPGDTRVIDPEFAYYGPIGLDLGAFAGNLLLSYFAQPGHADGGDDRRAFQDWLLDQVALFWQTFRRDFLALWRAGGEGDAYPPDMFADAAGQAALEAEREAFVDRLFADMLGFAGAKMIRRILGYAHVADFERIADPDRRARCESAALALARTLAVHAERFAAIGEVLEAARRCAADSDAGERR